MDNKTDIMIAKLSEEYNIEPDSLKKALMDFSDILGNIIINLLVESAEFRQLLFSFLQNS